MDSKSYIDLVRQMYAHPRLYGFFDTDEISDALNHFRSRIESILDRADKESRTRDAYLLTSMRFVAKSVHRQNFVANLYENAYIHSHFSEDTVLEASADTFIEDPGRLELCEEENALSISPRAYFSQLSSERKRLMYLIIKCAWDMDEPMIKKCSEGLGIPEQCLFEVIELARRRTESNRTHILEFNARLNSLWIRSRVLELRLESSLLDEEKEAVACTLRRCRQRYFKLLEKRKHRKPSISNQCVSQILGVPKGSVDSGIFYLKRSFKSGRRIAEYQKLG